MRAGHVDEMDLNVCGGCAQVLLRSVRDGAGEFPSLLRIAAFEHADDDERQIDPQSRCRMAA